MRSIKRLVVHCSATPDAMDVGFKEINQWHLDKGWKSCRGVGCGYHFIIRRNGTIEVGRTVDEIGAHVHGANSDSIGICLVGTHEFNQSQIKALKRVIEGLLVQFPGSTIHEHREFPSAKSQHKTCPNFHVKQTLGL